MRLRAARQILLTSLIAVLIVACSRGEKKIEKCHKPQEYQEARPGPRVRTPAGMEDLPEDERLRLPYGKTRNQPLPKGEPCLAEPPKF
jgi:uncharacterized lipoprotein